MDARPPLRSQEGFGTIQEIGYRVTMNSQSKPTLVDVAQAAGVSRSTASNVFAHPQRVRPAIRQRVEEAARSLGYLGPDPRGGRLRAGKFNALGFIIPGTYGLVNLIESPYGRELILGLSDACDAAGVSLTLVDGGGEQANTAVANALVDGFVLTNTRDPGLARTMAQRALPFTIIDMPAAPEFPSVGIDAHGGALEAARHLLAQGHRRFAIVSVRHEPGPAIVHPPGRGRRLHDAFPLDEAKLRGYAEALAEAGLSIDDMSIVESVPWDPEIGSAILEAAPDATALLVMSDRQALTVLREARKRGIAVPGALSIVGFDGVPEGAHASPRLTTVVQPIREKARLAAAMVLGLEPHARHILPARLHIRGSSGPAPA
ncbi:LacI family transcriptional regulator [Youhaiella tibetensis]|uniref:LacI family transcriptional regulator n=2 Tax=Paradevosia tibetensis TaxID=1447062 RepID=A0A5B9DR38_9HYPH|nr:LacI family transcriptional regulator [Youhaiella tibetensis]